MKKYYVFVKLGVQLTPESRVFKVRVGQSQRDQVLNRRVDSFASESGYMWRPWDADTEFFLSQCTCVKSVDRDFLPFPFHILVIDIADFYRALASDSLATLDYPVEVKRNFFKIASILSPSFRLKSHSQCITTPCHQRERKNLSRNEQDEFYSAIFGFCLVFALFLAVAFLEGSVVY